MEFRGKQGQFNWDANEKSKRKNKKEEKDDFKRKQSNLNILCITLVLRNRVSELQGGGCSDLKLLFFNLRYFMFVSLYESAEYQGFSRVFI